MHLLFNCAILFDLGSAFGISGIGQRHRGSYGCLGQPPSAAILAAVHLEWQPVFWWAFWRGVWMFRLPVLVLARRFPNLHGIAVA